MKLLPAGVTVRTERALVGTCGGDDANRGCV